MDDVDEYHIDNKSMTTAATMLITTITLVLDDEC